MRPLPTAGLVLLGLTLAGFLPAVAGDPPKGTPAVEAKPMAVKVFTLGRAEPQDVRSAWDVLLGDQTTFEMPATPADGKKKKKEKLPAQGGQFGPLAGQFGLCGFGGGLGGMGIGGTPVWRATTDDRTRQVVIRGGAPVVKTAGEIVAALDRADGTPLPKVETIRLHELKHADPNTLIQSLGELDIDGLKLHAVANLLLFAGKESDLATVAEVVKTLDVADRK